MELNENKTKSLIRLVGFMWDLGIINTPDYWYITSEINMKIPIEKVGYWDDIK